MPSITVELTETQLKGLQYVAVSPQEWAENALTNRARIANDEIVKKVVDHCLDNDITLPATREDMVAYAFDNEIVMTAEARQQANVDAYAEM